MGDHFYACYSSIVNAHINAHFRSFAQPLIEGAVTIAQSSTSGRMSTVFFNLLELNVRASMRVKHSRALTISVLPAQINAFLGSSLQPTQLIYAQSRPRLD